MTDEADYDPEVEAGGTLTPAEYQRLKSHFHGNDLYQRLKSTDQRYLVIGSNRGERGKRRERVCELLDRRTGSIAVRLEDFGFGDDEIELWAGAFDLLAAHASHIVGVLEDFDGSHVWELGYLHYHRDILWLLKRIYEDDDVQREKYDNGMAASHLTAIEEFASDRIIEWSDPNELPTVVQQIP